MPLTAYEARMFAERAAMALRRTARAARTREAVRAVAWLHDVARVLDEHFHLAVAAVELRGAGERRLALEAEREAAALSDAYSPHFAVERERAARVLASLRSSAEGAPADAVKA